MSTPAPEAVGPWGGASTPSDDWRPFCPHCGLVERIDDDGTCDMCGSDTCGLDQLREHLRAHGLHVVTDADKAVLDAVAAAPVDRVGYWAENATDPHARAVWTAELARRVSDAG